jgi:hypothetical protein
MSRRFYSSIAERTTLAFAVNATTTTFIANAVVGWPSNTPYTLIIDGDTINEELVTVTNRSGTTLTVVRGVDGSTGKAHDSGADVRHGVSGRDFDEPNAHVNNTTSAHGLTIADVVTVAGTQTLTNKTINGATIDSATITNGTVDATSLQEGGVQVVTVTGTQTLTNKAMVVGINAQTGSSYTLVLADASKIIEMSNSSANTVTVPTDSDVAFPVGTTIDIVQMGTGQTSVAGASGVTVNARNGLKINGQYSGASLVKRATDTWLLIGATIA